MILNTKTIKLDINKKMFETITAKQGDTKSRFILFNLYDGPIQFDLTGRTVRVYGEKKDNTTIFNDLVINDAKKGYCTLELTNQMLAVEGMNELELVIFEGEKRLSTMPFILNVIGSKYSEDAIVSTNEFTALMNALKTVGDIDNKAEKKEVEKLSEQLDNKANLTDVAKISSGTPLFADSISQMVDKTRNYVNTTDGYLYIHNGTQFISSGVKYQEKGISDGQVSPEKTSFFIENLFDKLDVEDGCYYDSSNNKVNNANYVETNYIPIHPNQILMLTKNLNGLNTQITKFYDKDKVFINGQNSIADNQIAGQIDQSKHSNCAYIRISLSKSSLDQYMLTTGVTIPSEILPFGINFSKGNYITEQLEKNTSDISINKSEIEQLKNNGVITNSKLKGKKWCVVGDSITEANSTASIKYHDIIKNNLGCTIYNHGKSGTGYAVSYAGGLAIVDRINQIPSDSDLITIFAGTNDWGRNLTTLGTFNDTTKNTFYGALKITLETIINNFPTKRIGVITPIPRSNYRNTNNANETLKQYRDAIIEVCEYYSIPCLDLYKESGFYPTNSTFKTTYIPDGLHPNNLGHEILADKIAKFIEQL